MRRSDDLTSVNYYYLTDEGCEIPLSEQVDTAVDRGVKMIQYRRKSGTDLERYEEARELANICKNEAIFIVNDRLDIALAVEADGVHLGQDDLPPHIAQELVGDMLIGVSTHDLEQAKQAEAVADYIAVGPVHETETKQDPDRALGVETAVRIAGSVEVPTTAIGGVNQEDILKLAEKFDMVCAISSVTREGDLSEKIGDFEDDMREAKKKNGRRRRRKVRE